MKRLLMVGSTFTSIVPEPTRLPDSKMIAGGTVRTLTSEDVGVLFNAAANAPASSGLCADGVVAGAVVALVGSAGEGAGAGAAGTGVAGSGGFGAGFAAGAAAAGRFDGASACGVPLCPASAERRIHDTLVTISAAAITAGAITLLPLLRR